MAAARRRLGSPRHRHPILLALAFLGAALSVSDFACRGAAGGDAAAIRALVKREVDAINARDLKALSEIWSQDQQTLLFDVPPPGRFEGWDRIGHLFKEFFDRMSEVHLAIDALRITVDGGLGYATYDWAMTGRMGDYVVDDRGQATAVYHKERGGWRLVHSHYSAVPPGPVSAGSAAPGPSPAASSPPR